MGYAIKCVSLPARYGITSDNDFRQPFIRDYAVSVARVPWIRVWIAWSDVDGPNTVFPGAGASDGHWAQWATYHTNPQFLALDALIADARSNGISVMLSISQYFPAPAANGATGPEPGTNKEASRRLPSSVALGSPWERFVTYCYNRYRSRYDLASPSGFYNATGPNPSNPFGNPYSTRINALSIVNEPNFEAWQDQHAGCAAALMMQSMEAALYYWQSFAPSYGQAIFAPDFSDTETLYTSGGVLRAMGYTEATNELLSILGNWQPRVYFAWSHHNYADIDNQTDYRLNAVHDILVNRNWRGGGDRYIYVTEGGYSLSKPGATTTIQRDKFVNHWNRARSSDYRMGTQHMVRNSFANVLGTGMTDPTGATHYPLYDGFAALEPRRP